MGAKNLSFFPGKVSDVPFGETEPECRRVAAAMQASAIKGSVGRGLRFRPDDERETCRYRRLSCGIYGYSAGSTVFCGIYGILRDLVSR